MSKGVRGQRDDPDRRRRVDAAVRHAKTMANAGAVPGPVIYRPGQPARRDAGPREPGLERPPVNNARANALCEALGITTTTFRIMPSATGLQSDAAAKVANSEKHPRSIKAVASKAVIADIKTPANPKMEKPDRPVLRLSAKPKKQKPKKAPEPKPLQANGSAARHKKEAAAARRRALTEQNATSRRALNARLRTQAEAVPVEAVSPFVDLQRRWRSAFTYLQRFGELAPNAPDVLAAKVRLDEIEREWDRRIGLPPEDPEYFTWPTTEVSAASGSDANVEWREIGMFSYLGYHVGMTSDLTGIQRSKRCCQSNANRSPHDAVRALRAAT